MVPYFFAHDELNYARHTPLYLFIMTELETKDIDSWNYLKNNFSVNKFGYCFIPYDIIML